MIDNEKIDNSNNKRDFMKLYRQHSAQTQDENQVINFFHVKFSIINKWIIVNLNLRWDRKAENFSFSVAVEYTNEVIRLVNNSSPFTIHDARISSSSGTERDKNKCFGPTSTIITLLTQRGADLSKEFYPHNLNNRWNWG